MTERISNRPATFWWAVFLFGVVAVFLVMAGAAAMLQGGGKAHALPTDVTANKSDTAQPGSVDGIDWWTSLQNTSQTAQTVEFSDTYQPGGSGSAITDWATLGASPSCVSSSTQLNCTVTIPPLSTVFIAVHMTDATPQCGPQTVTNSLVVTQGGTNVTGSPDTNNTYVFPGVPGLCTTFQLCKVWHPQGAIAANRSFTFEVSDTSQTQQVNIGNVAENGVPVCVSVSAATGPVRITETVPSGFSQPDWFRDGLEVDEGGEGPVMTMDLESDTCFSDLPNLIAAFEVQDVVPANDCVVTFTNEDTDTAPSPSPTPTRTPTPIRTRFVPCQTCFEPLPTSTSTPRPQSPTATNTVAPPSPPPPATATPTTGTGSTTLTDENRTQTAVAAAKTAAAQVTPIAPRTGDGTEAGPGDGALNLAFAVAGMIAAGTGISLMAARRRR